MQSSAHVRRGKHGSWLSTFSRLWIERQYQGVSSVAGTQLFILKFCLLLGFSFGLLRPLFVYTGRHRHLGSLHGFFKTNEPSRSPGYSTAIRSCEKGRQWQRALDFFGEMPEMSVARNSMAFNSATWRK